jgi:hypothetical protein
MSPPQSLLTIVKQKEYRTVQCTVQVRKEYRTENFRLRPLQTKKLVSLQKENSQNAPISATFCLVQMKKSCYYVNPNFSLSPVNPQRCLLNW